MNERKRYMIWTAVVCVILGASGMIIGYRLDGFHAWPEGQMVEFAFYGCLIGIAGAVVTGILISAAAREKLWLVALIGCVVVFAGSAAYGAKKANDLVEWGRQMFGPREK